MSTPTDPSSPAEPVGTRPPSTEEIPVAAQAGATAVGRQPLPPHPGAVAPTPVPAAPVPGPQPTGPVDFMPSLPGFGAPPVPPPPAPPVAQPTTAAQPAGPPQPAPSWPDTLESEDAAPARPRGGDGARDPKALVGVGLAALALVLVLLGLTLDFGTTSFWSAVPLWSAFATLCAVLGLLTFAAFYPAGNRLRSGPAWRVAAACLVGLSVFWLLVVLPLADSDRGFLLTAALACLGGALWIGPRTRS